ncbi:MAG: hypothetical protein H6641_19435 [Caldilineaceae bacterium]|nr:hypothetical protein [Caldilineaceae bacterium]
MGHYDHVAWLAKRSEVRSVQPPVDVVSIAPAEYSPIYIENALQAHDGVSEQTNATERSVALVVRLAPFSAVWLVLAVAIGVAARSSVVGLLAFALLTGATYAAMDRTEYRFSRNGLERHRIDAAERIALEQMAHVQELRRMALEMYLRQLEGVGDE